MSWNNDDWRRRDEQVHETQFRDSDRKILMPRIDPDLYEAMQHYMMVRRLSFDLALDFGWYPAFYKGPRIIIPCVRTDGKNFWQGRLLDNVIAEGMMYKRWESPWGPRGDSVAYLPSRGAAIAVVVEGPMDALAAADCGVSAVATLGVGAPDPVLAHVATLVQGFNKVLIVPDNDELSAWARIQAALGSMGVHAEMRPPYAKDLAGMSAHTREELLYGG